jgi:hypothetical protein
MDEVVSDPKLVIAINKAMHQYVDRKSDESCTDIPRIWLGSKQKCFAGELNRSISLGEFISKLNQKKYARDRNQFRSCIDIDKYNPQNCASIGTAISNNNSNNQDCTHFIIPYKNAEVDNWKVEDLLQYELFKQFYTGEGGSKGNKLSHTELFGLATNMLPLVGGQDLFKELLDNNLNYSREKYSIMSFVKDREFLSQYISGFSPFESDQKHPHQTFVQALRKRGKVTVYEEPKLISVAEAEQQLATAFRRMMEADDQKIYMLKCAPGLGKSEYIKNLKGIMAAFPDHALLTEQYQSSRLLDIDEKLTTPNVKGRFSRLMEQHFDAPYKIDLAANVRMKIRLLAAGAVLSPYQTKGDVLAANLFLNQLEEVEQAHSKTIFTTHARALLTSWAHNTLVFDEDPINSILEQHVALISEIDMLKKELAIRGVNVDALTELVRQPDFENPKPTPKIGVDKDLLYELCAARLFTSHVLRFFESESYITHNGHIHYCVNKSDRFDISKMHVICDATARLEVYRRLFGDRLEVVDISNVKNLGTINQYINRSCSKSGLETYSGKLSVATTMPTITFKDFKHNFANATPEMHFGRVRGSNILSGRNINVLGTFHYNDTHYRFLAYATGIANSDWTMREQPVRYNGRAFKITTFSDPILQRIHLETVEGELLQAVHRARLLHYDCTVNLYSNFPLQQANYFY